MKQNYTGQKKVNCRVSKIEKQKYKNLKWSEFCGLWAYFIYYNANHMKSYTEQTFINGHKYHLKSKKG